MKKRKLYSNPTKAARHAAHKCARTPVRMVAGGDPCNDICFEARVMRALFPQHEWHSYSRYVISREGKHGVKFWEFVW